MSHASFTLAVHCNADIGGCDYYRAILPARFLANHAFQRHGVTVRLTDHIRDAERFRAVLVHRTVPDHFLRHLLARQARGERLWWDTDDLLTHLPAWNPLSGNWKPADRDRWDALSGLAYVRTVSTAAMQRHVPRSAVCPNLVDLNDWGGGVLQQPTSPGEKVRVLWAGSDTHYGDLQQVVPAIREILDRHADRVDVYFAGYVPPELVQTHFGRFHSLPMTPVQNYPKLMLAIRPHVALAPLADCEFNRCKSNCKWLEATLAGAALVASPLDPYLHLPASFAREDSGAWFDAIMRLVDSYEARAELQHASHDLVCRQYSWQRSDFGFGAWADAASAAVAG